MYYSLIPLFLLLLLLMTIETGNASSPIANLPVEEQSLAVTVDPWGLAFSDQLARYRSHFADDPEAPFVMGFTHNLVKIWPNKYWFRGETVLPGSHETAEQVWGATGTTVSLQVAVLPKIGASAGRYTIQTTSSLPIHIYRQEFVKIASVPYGAFRSDYWPDLLVPETTCDVSGTNLGLFLVEVEIPADERRLTTTCSVSIRDDNGHQATIDLPIRIVPLPKQEASYPVVAWFAEQNLSESQIADMCDMSLAHHIQPLMAGQVQSAWNPEDTKQFDAFVTHQMARGQRFFQIAEPDAALYEHIKAKGWLKHFMIYSNDDEPTVETFNKSNIPYAKKIHEKFPCLTIFLASDYHASMSEGCDRWLTNLSNSTYNPVSFAIPAKPEMWHYYAHLPIRFQMRAPMIQAPNMQIDGAALEPRLACWMSWYYGAKGIFIYSGNTDWPKAIWETHTLSSQPMPYPYAGCHNGDGFLMYPPRSEGGPVLPGLRLKSIRDAVDDIAILEACKAKFGKQWKEKMAITPDVFCHPQYYDHLPETLLNKREALLKHWRKNKQLKIREGIHETSENIV